MLSGSMSEGYLSLYITPVICIFTDSSMGPTRGTPPAWLVLCYLGVCLRVVFLQILPCSAKRGRPLLVGAMLSGSMSGDYLSLYFTPCFLLSQIRPCSARRGTPLLVGATLSGSMSGVTVRQLARSNTATCTTTWIVLVTSSMSTVTVNGTRSANRDGIAMRCQQHEII